MSAEHDRIKKIALNNSNVIGALKLIDAECIIDRELEEMKKDVMV